MRLYQYQKDGVEWMLKKERTRDSHGVSGGILADDMGLGKTIQALALIDANPKRTLIVCPISVMHQWREECTRFLPGINVLTVNVTNVRKMSSGEINPLYLSVQDIESADVVIASHGCFSNASAVEDLDNHSLIHASFERVVFDEAHVMKNLKSNSAWYATQIRAPLRWCLTGTPVVTRKPGTSTCNHKSEDITSLIVFLLGNFERRPTAKKLAKNNEYRKMLIFRRTKDSVAGENQRLRLPKATIDLEMVTFAPEDREGYAALYRAGRLLTRRVHEGEVEGFTHVLAVITKLRQFCSATPAKLDALSRCFDRHPPGTRSLVFCNYVDEMKNVAKCVEQSTDHVMYYHGGMNAEQKDEVVKTFMDTSPRYAMKSMCIVMQFVAGSVGLNLQAAQKVYIMSPHWSAASELQAISRAHRTKTLHEISVTRFVMKDTIEEYIHLRQKAKLSTAAHYLDDPKISDALVAWNRKSVTWQEAKELFDSDLFD